MATNDRLEPVRESKHTQLANSIRALEKTCDRLEAFHSEIIDAPEIKSTDCGLAGSKPTYTPSLANVLNESPGKLGDINARLNDLLGRLRDVLY